MVEEHGEEEGGLPSSQRFGGNADEDDLRDPPGHGGDHLAGMEAHGRRGVQVEVGVVDGVEAPQRCPAMEQDVPHPQRVVEQEEGERALQRARQAQARDEPPPPALHERGHAPRQRAVRDLHGGGGRGREREVAAPVTSLRLDASPQRTSLLAEGEKTEDGGGEAGADPPSENVRAPPRRHGPRILPSPMASPNR
jgi:hypothetical protein